MRKMAVVGVWQGINVPRTQEQRKGSMARDEAAKRGEFWTLS